MITHTAVCDLCGATLTSWSDQTGALEELAGCGWAALSAFEIYNGVRIPREIHICGDHPIGTGTMCTECYADLAPDRWTVVVGDSQGTLSQRCFECQHMAVLGVRPYRAVL